MSSWPRSLPRVAGAAALAIAVCAPIPALAKDVCVSENPAGGTFVFQKVKKLKPGKAVPLVGVFILGTPAESYPVTGAAVLRAGGNVEVAVDVHAMSANVFAGAKFSASMQTFTDFTGTGGKDTDGDLVADVTAYGWVFADCKTIEIP
jgi:hypothetical protein